MSALLAALALVVAQTDVTFAWAPPEGQSPKYYYVLVAETGAGFQTFTTYSPSIDLDLELGKDFTIRVAACSEGVCGAWSPSSELISLNHSADLSGDSVVGLPDFRLVISQIGQATPDDLDGDGMMGFTDLNVWRGKIGQCVGPISLNGSMAEAYLPCELVFH